MSSPTTTEPPGGVLLVDKDPGFTSHNAVALCRRVLGTKKVGHCGTLDPMATGMLIVVIGKATKLQDKLMCEDKVYSATMKLGVETNSQDADGEVVAVKPTAGISEEQIHAAFEHFHTEFDQVPPMYSAVKINGKKLSELARKGVEVERKARSVTIYALDLLDERSPEGDFLLRVRCSKGTYIRTLCHDIGQALGCGGCMASLKRTEACGFSLEEAHSLDEVVAAPDPAALLRPVDQLFRDRPAISVNAKGEEKLRHGNSLTASKLEEGEYRVYGPTGEFLLLGKAGQGKLTTIKSFFEV